MLLALAAHGAPPRWCRAPQPGSWRSALASHVVTLSRRVAVLPIVGAGDGRSFFAELYSPGFSGVARVDARTSHVTRIRRFPSARDDQADGSFDGRWFVWNEYHSLSGFDDFTTFAWDSHTGAVTQIGGATPNPAGGFWPSGWRQPDARAGFVTWTQGSGPDGEGDVHVYDLAAGVDRIVRHGHPQGPFFVAGPTVVWPESLAPGAWTRMLAADPRTGAAVATPPALGRLRGISALFTDGRRLAYPSAKFLSLWWARRTGSCSCRCARYRVSPAACAKATAAGTAPSRSTLGSAPVRSSTVDGVPGSSPASTSALHAARICSGTSSRRRGSGPPCRFALVASTGPVAASTAVVAGGSSGTRTPIVSGFSPASHAKLMVAAVVEDQSLTRCKIHLHQP